MVTAGLYMVTRTNVIFQHSKTMMLVVALVGAATAIFAATIAITQNDIKKVLAYSTVSQLGFMFMACGVGAFVIGIFHVMTHAFFKALMFLGAGSVIHGMHHEQDMRRMGGLKKYMPYTYMTFLAGWLAICGIIPFSGFWSKDEILWNAASTSVIPNGWLVWIVGTIAATCTAFYMTRLVAMTFWGKEKFLNGHQHTPGHEVHADHATPATHAHVPHESPPSMWIPLVALAVLATIGGLIGVGPAFKFLTGSEHPGGRLNIVNYLDPIIWNSETGEFGREHAAVVSEHGAEPAATTAHGETRTAELVPAPGEAELFKEATTTHEGFNLAHAAEGVLGSHLA
ncbi:MAG TPA: proton-conducting transporter membrane subunit, partial [Pyrinomonadaceae bacterium]|nr:proton-conducting transporter membrane subunit [Pyrinomonadaceae bacterium]